LLRIVLQSPDFRALLPGSSPLRSRRWLDRRSARSSPGFRFLFRVSPSARVSMSPKAHLPPPSSFAHPRAAPECHSTTHVLLGVCPRWSWPRPRRDRAYPLEVCLPRRRPLLFRRPPVLAHCFASGPGRVAAASGTLFGQ
jgi:hypothetical protein